MDNPHLDIDTIAEEKVADFLSRVAAVRQSLHKVIVAQDEALDLLLVCAVTGHHALLVGVPGLAKTLMVKTLARLQLTFRRIQFTPDLMPSDITGTRSSRRRPRRAGRAWSSARAGLRQHGAGRRDQPRPAQDAGRAPGGHGGAARHRRRQDLPAGRTVPRRWPRRTPSSRKAPIRCPRPSSTAS